jgi:hypothetical protein
LSGPAGYNSIAGLGWQPEKVKHNHRNAMKLQAFAVLAAALLLASCNDAVIPVCPSVSVLSDTADLTVFRAGAPRDPSGEAYTAAIDNIRSSCTYKKGTAFSVSNVSFTVRAVRAPSPDAARYVLPYFLTTSQGDRLLGKKNLRLVLSFPAGSAAASVDETLDDTTVNLEPGHPPTDYQLLVGFQLSEAERAYNQKRVRYAP